jgi:alpha-ketoglutarate-dependent taurine dioxygenase
MDQHSPFDLDNHTAYAEWRAGKLAQPRVPAEVVIDDPTHLNAAEQQQLVSACRSNNFALFRYRHIPDDPEAALSQFGKAFGLTSMDANLCAEDTGLTEITVKQTHTDNIYIPYTNRPIGWHTDGYYNPGDQQIHGMLLYCHQPAAEGGISGVLDHEIAYIRLRDQNPEWIRALMADDAFTIPPNVEGGEQIRGATSGPVFSLSNGGHSLHMRYSARQRNILWKDDPATRDAAAFLLALFSSDDDHILQLKLERGQGLISNNVLHKRSGFTDAADPALKRVFYRARYYDRVQQTAAADC